MTMKNLVKKAKSKSWLLLPTAFVVFAFLTYSMFLGLYFALAGALNVDLNDPKLLPNELHYLIYLVSLAGGMVSIIYIGEVIWKKVDRQVLSNKESRNIHHVNMIKKYILLGDKDRSEKLLDQYKNSNYKNDKMLYFYYGAYNLKFSDLNVVDVLSSINFKK